MSVRTTWIAMFVEMIAAIKAGAPISAAQILA